MHACTCAVLACTLQLLMAEARGHPRVLVRRRVTTQHECWPARGRPCAALLQAHAGVTWHSRTAARKARAGHNDMGMRMGSFQPDKSDRAVPRSILDAVCVCVCVRVCACVCVCVSQ